MRAYYLRACLVSVLASVCPRECALPCVRACVRHVRPSRALLPTSARLPLFARAVAAFTPAHVDSDAFAGLRRSPPVALNDCFIHNASFIAPIIEPTADRYMIGSNCAVNQARCACERARASTRAASRVRYYRLGADDN